MQLSVPNRTSPKNGSFDSQPSSVKNWIERLPMANVGETTKLLFEALNDLNHQDIPAQQRFKTLELLQEPVRFVTDHMKKHVVGKPLPPMMKNLKIAHLSREITHALATGYKVLVMEQIAGVGRKDRKLLVTAIHRSVKLLGVVLLKAFQVYEPYPESVWLEIHSLYRYAESNGLHRNKVMDVVAAVQHTSTVTDCYKQILLLALACPYRLRHGEAEDIYNALEDWAKFSDLKMLEEKPNALFSVNLDSDEPPSYLVLRDTNENCGTTRTLDTGRLAEHARKAISETRESRPTGIKLSTIKHLMLVWGVMPKRRYSRVKDQSQVIVSMGLSSIHYFVSGEAVFNQTPVSKKCHTDLSADPGPVPHIQEPASFGARDVRASEGNMPDVWEMNYRIEGEALPSNLETAVARAASGMQINTSHRTQNWKMVNISAGGYCLLWDNLETTRAQVGELLGIREESDPDTFHWRLGVIRWLKFADKRGLELGVQMLSPGAVAIAGQPEQRGTKNHEFTRGLLLPEIASIQQSATLLLPSPPFRVGDSAVINCHGKNVRVELTKLVENTGSFAQFQFTALGEIKLPGQKKPASKTMSSDFDDVWELL
ncbi:hypothetical protein DFR30_0693 [Thiogranum longum]|uniref:GTPase n=1 Tax=Thiogranum longum TaxID=1537524 RepID=A0A4R1HAD2_9GAMM|nr:hypothetical protein [Thiogranum longum]TCK17463.1 hypothetical protein DFR30_0693 [Thiogranum longum]